MTPEVEAQIKDQTSERMHHRLGDGHLSAHADFLDVQWEWTKESGMIDEEVDIQSCG